MTIATNQTLADTSRVFELAGKLTMIGSWVVIEQETGTTAIITPGSTSISNYGDTLEMAGEAATLQMTCKDGILSVSALLPGANDLAAGAKESWQGLFSLAIGEEQAAIVKKEISIADTQEDSLVLPLVQVTAQNSLVSKILAAETITITAANMALHRVRARYELSGNEEAFQALELRCPWLRSP